MAETPRLKLPLLDPAQAQKHVTHNEALLQLDLLTGVIAALTRSRTTPPSGPVDGDVHILGGTGTGVWIGFSSGDLALRIDGAWRRVLPSAGMVASVVAENGALYYYPGGSWQLLRQDNTPSCRASVIHFSDSFAAQQLGVDSGSLYKQPSGVAVALETYSRGKFRADANCILGVSGRTTTQMLAAFKTEVVPVANKAGIILIDGGRNDAISTMANAQTTVANLQAIVAQSKGLGLLPVVCLPHPPRGWMTSATARKLWAWTNDRMRYWCADTGIPFLDYWRDIVDPSSDIGVMLPAYSMEDAVSTLHLSTAGARVVGLKALELLGPIIPDQPRSQGVWDEWDAVLNPTGNIARLVHTDALRFAGSGGTVENGVTGSVANGMFLTCYSGTGSQCVASKVAGVSGLGRSGGDRQRLAFAGTTSFWGGEMYGGFTIPPELANMPVELEVEAVTTFSAQRVSLGIQLRPGVGGTPASAVNISPNSGDHILVRTHRGILGNSGSWCQIALGVFPLSGFAGSIEFFNVFLRPVA